MRRRIDPVDGFHRTPYRGAGHRERAECGEQGEQEREAVLLEIGERQQHDDQRRHDVAEGHWRDQRHADQQHRRADEPPRRREDGGPARPDQPLDPGEPRHHDVDDARQLIDPDLAARHRPRQRSRVVTEDELDRRPGDQQADDGRRTRQQGDDGHDQQGQTERALSEFGDQPADGDARAFGPVQHARQVDRGGNRERQCVVLGQSRSSVATKGPKRPAALQSESVKMLGQGRHGRPVVGKAYPWIMNKVAFLRERLELACGRTCTRAGPRRLSVCRIEQPARPAVLLGRACSKSVRLPSPSPTKLRLAMAERSVCSRPSGDAP